MLDLAKHIVQQKAAEFDPEKFEDRYESALVDLINRKRNGERVTARRHAPRRPVDERRRHAGNGDPASDYFGGRSSPTSHAVIDGSCSGSI
jgi:hypothetical protein